MRALCLCLCINVDMHEEYILCDLELLDIYEHEHVIDAYFIQNTSPMGDVSNDCLDDYIRFLLCVVATQ